MRHRLFRYFIVSLLLLSAGPMHANTPANKISQFILKNMNMDGYVTMLKEHYGGKESQMNGAFGAFVEEIRTALVTNPLIRHDAWNFLEPILKSLTPAPTQLTFVEFEKVFLNLANSYANFGPMANKLLAPEEMIAHIDAGDFLGLYLGSDVAPGQLPASQLGDKLYVFPGYYSGDAMLVEVGRRDLASTVFHEFLHHVVHVLYSMRFLPEDFTEQQTIWIGPYLEPSNFGNNYEHLWVYSASEHMDAYLSPDFLKKLATAGIFPTVTALHWLPLGNGSRL